MILILQYDGWHVDDTDTNNFIGEQKMKLKDYLIKNKIKMIEFSKSAGVGYNTVCNWCSGRKLPSEISQALIQSATHGKVTRKDWKVE